MKEVLSKRGALLFEAYNTVMKPWLIATEWPMLTDAQKLLDEFNIKNHVELCVREIFNCTVKSENMGMTPIEPVDIILKSARLAIEDCNTALMQPGKIDKRVIQLRIELAKIAINAYTPKP